MAALSDFDPTVTAIFEADMIAEADAQNWVDKLPVPGDSSAGGALGVDGIDRGRRGEEQAREREEDRGNAEAEGHDDRVDARSARAAGQRSAPPGAVTV